jgi:outer membrane protein TolC
MLNTAMAQRRVLNKEYAPVFHFLGGFNLRGSGQDLSATGRQSQGGAGVFPVVPNYQVAMIVNWNFLDWFRIRQEKRIQDQRIAAQQQDLNLVLQNLKTEDLKARSQIRTALALAANMPVQVDASVVAVRQAQARYQTGLGSVAQVAEANTVLAQSRMQEAIARVGVWRAMLQVSAVHGDLRPFMAEADRIQKGI